MHESDGWQITQLQLRRDIRRSANVFVTDYEVSSEHHKICSLIYLLNCSSCKVKHGNSRW